MKKRKLMTSLAVIGQFSISSLAIANSDVIANPDNGHSYQRIDTEKTWQDARDYCEEQGGYLATITSEAENRFVYDQVGKDDIWIWLGGTDRYEEGQWEWVTGETWDYENWYIQFGPNQLAYYSNAASKWADWTQSETYPFICEWDDANNASDPISIAKQEGRQGCIDNPASCGLQSECPAPAPSEPVHATYDTKSGIVHIPFIDVPDILGGVTVYEADLFQRPFTLIFDLDMETVKPR
jgi:hypothetical protein